MFDEDEDYEKEHYSKEYIAAQESLGEVLKDAIKDGEIDPGEFLNALREAVIQIIHEDGLKATENYRLREMREEIAQAIEDYEHRNE